jgi:sec-independent protein translocase protein TatA
MFGLGPMELMIVGVIAVLLFGSRLPEVGRSLGRGMMEFKKGMRDIQNQMDSAISEPSPSQMVRHHSAVDESEEPTAPKFEPPPREPFESPNHTPGEPRS